MNAPDPTLPPVNGGNNRSFWAALAVLALAAAGLLWWWSRTPAPSASRSVLAQALFLCSDDKTIDATFYRGSSIPAVLPGQPPVPSGSVSLQLSDGRLLDLPQTVSASGIRYATSSEWFVFWSKGNTAFIEQSGVQTYSNCIKAAGDPGGLPEAYADRTYDFTIRYPEGYAVDPTYAYQGFGPGKDISGVKFTVPSSMATGTNLGQDTYFSVEQIPTPPAQADGASSCSSSLFLPELNARGGNQRTVSENGMEYSVASTTGAGAGNRYEETVYAIPGSNPCTAVRYFVHYGVIENYPPGAVSAFDRSALMSQFDAMRRTLIVGL